jgi:putative DNA primase/helicase
MSPLASVVPGDGEGNFDPNADPVVWGTHDKPEIVQWLWRGKIVRGGLQLLAGEPGRGKSTILCDLAARITAGAAWPDGQAGEDPARVVLMTKEDDYHSVWLPRFMAAGGDKNLLGHVPMWRPFVLDTKEGLQWMKHHMKVNNPRVALFIVDPLDDFTGTNMDSHKAKSVRNALMHVHVLATRYQSAIVAIKHLNKVGEAVAGKTPLQRLEGSAAYGAIPRNVLVVATGAGPRLFFGVLKGSLVPLAQQTAMEYDTESVPHPTDPDPESAVSHLVWKEECAVSMNTLMNNPATEMKPLRPSPEFEKALVYLTQALGDGLPHPIGPIRQGAKELGLAGSTLDRARIKLKVRSELGCYLLPAPATTVTAPLPDAPSPPGPLPVAS